MIKILETEIDFDFCEVENMSKFENALEEYMKELEIIKSFEGKESEGIMKLCKVVYKLFDNVVGDGTASKIFGNKNNFALCMEATGQFIKAKEDSIADKYISKEA